MLPLDSYIYINKIEISDAVPTMRFWNNLHQVLSQSNDWKYRLISICQSSVLNKFLNKTTNKSNFNIFLVVSKKNTCLFTSQLACVEMHIDSVMS
jgi:hypothetical protein